MFDEAVLSCIAVSFVSWKTMSTTAIGGSGSTSISMMGPIEYSLVWPARSRHG